MSINFAAVNIWVTTKLIPGVTQIMSKLPALLSKDETDVAAAVNAIQAVFADLQAGVAAFASVK